MASAVRTAAGLRGEWRVGWTNLGPLSEIIERTALGVSEDEEEDDGD
jgi:hypothetical protein